MPGQVLGGRNLFSQGHEAPSPRLLCQHDVSAETTVTGLYMITFWLVSSHSLSSLSVCVLICSFKDTSQIRLGPILMTSL